MVGSLRSTVDGTGESRTGELCSSGTKTLRFGSWTGGASSKREGTEWLDLQNLDYLTSCIWFQISIALVLSKARPFMTLWLWNWATGIFATQYYHLVPTGSPETAVLCWPPVLHFFLRFQYSSALNTTCQAPHGSLHQVVLSYKAHQKSGLPIWPSLFHIIQSHVLNSANHPVRQTHQVAFGDAEHLNESYNSVDLSFLQILQFQFTSNTTLTYSWISMITLPEINIATTKKIIPKESSL